MAVTDRIPETDEREPYTGSGCSSRFTDTDTRNFYVFIKKFESYPVFGLSAAAGAGSFFFGPATATLYTPPRAVSAAV
jgi:hypothetical protein